MTNVGQVSLEEVQLMLRIAREASQSGPFPERMASISESLSVLVPSGMITALVLDPRARPTEAHFWNGDRDTLVRYAQHYRHLDPMGRGIEKATGKPLLLTDCMAPGEFGRDEFTSDLLMPLGVRWIMGIAHRMTDGGRVAITLQRSRSLGDFTSHEREVLRLIAPDLAHAAFSSVLREKLAAAPPGVAEHSGPIGLLFDASGTMVHADERGTAFLRNLAGRDDVLARLGSLVLRLLRETASPSCTHAIRTADGMALQVSLSVVAGITPHRVLAVVERVPAGSPEYFREACDKAALTGREREVAQLALEGLGNRGIAHRLRMSESTVKFHLANVYRKSRAPSRADLFHVLTGALPGGTDRAHLLGT